MRTNRTLIKNIQASMESAADHIEHGNIDAALEIIRDVRRVCEIEYDVLLATEPLA